jgi:hypothetical protein
MPAPKVETTVDLANCYHPKGVREFDRNSTDGLRKSVGHCHDVNLRVIEAHTKQWIEIGTLKNQASNLKLMIWILSGVLTATCAVLGFVVELAVK